MDRHQLHASGLLFQHGGLGLLADFVLVLQKIDEGAERAGTRGFKAAGEIAEPVHIGQAPFAAGMKG